MKTKDKTICSIRILKRKDLNLYKIIILVEKLYSFNNKYILSLSLFICDLFDTKHLYSILLSKFIL